MEKSKKCVGQHGNGWLDPEGRFYAFSESNHHCIWCEKNFDQSCRAAHRGTRACGMDVSGWFKLTEGRWIIAHPMKMKQAQYDFIMEWHNRTGRVLDEFMQLVKERWE
ncbi:MAG: hypothetical protein PHV34_08350 [Verrucomicrobiae bacterium]|nr:hypothetical protein [Verrucomicrobiae bacterium]